MAARRARASSSLMMPAFRSASIAICLPGMASNVNRAATSLMRVAPLVMTTNWMTTMMVKMITPTASCPPVTRSANACTTSPAAWVSPVPVRISRVAATFSTSRNSVMASSSEGKTANSSGLLTYMVVTSTSTLSIRLQTSSTSSIHVGSGTSSTTSSPMNANGNSIPRCSWTRAKTGLVGMADMCGEWGVGSGESGVGSEQLH